MTLKNEIDEICAEVVTEFEGWCYGASVFKKKLFKHVTLGIRPAFGYTNGIDPHTMISPNIWIELRPLERLMKAIVGYDTILSFILFQQVKQDLQHFPANMVVGGAIWKNRRDHIVEHSGKLIPWPQGWIGIEDAPSIIKAMMTDGIALIHKYYDLSSEANLIANLPLGDQTTILGAREGSFGVMYCLSRCATGDFDFVMKYRNDEIKTVTPKRMDEIDKIVAALPALKAKYEKTGSIF